MNKLITLVLFVSFVAAANAQPSSDNVARKYSAFKKILPGSQLHFVFNQDKYSAGDTIFFKAYFLRDDHQPVPGRQLIKMNFVAAGGLTLQSFLFPVDNGSGFNQIILPETLSPGIYMVAAYSRWMKNFDIPPIYTKEITVIGDKQVVSTAPNNTQPAKISVNDNTITVAIADQRMLRYQRMRLIVTSKGQVTFIRSFLQGIHNNVSVEVGKDVLKPGLNLVSVVDQQWLTVGTNSFYVPEEHPVTAVIEGEPSLFTRKNTRLTVSVVDDNKQPLQGEFSISVLNPVAADSARSDLRKGLAMSAPRTESWRQIVNGRGAQRYNYKSDLSKEGRVFLPDGSPVRDQTRLFFYFQQNDVMTQATTSGGKIKLAVPDIKGDDNLFYLAEYSGQQIPDVRIEWKETSIDLPAPNPSRELSEGDLYGIFAANKKLIDKAFGYYETTPANIANSIERNTSELENRILQGPDITINMDDYVTFDTMNEMIKEIIPGLNVRSVRGKQVVQMGLQTGIPESEPLFIIDGAATNASGYFLSLKPIDLNSIKLVNNPRKVTALGPMGKSGVVLVESKSGNLQAPTDASTEIEGINRAISFRQPSHNDLRRPDFRSTIYWNPIVKTDASGKAVVEFQCSDDLGPIKVRVDGMTLDGRPFSGEVTLNSVLAEK